MTCRILTLVVLLLAAILPACAQFRGMAGARGGMAPAGMGARTMPALAARPGGMGVRPMSGLGPRAGVAPRVGTGSTATGPRRTFGFGQPFFGFGHPFFNPFFPPTVSPLFNPLFDGFGFTQPAFSPFFGNPFFHTGFGGFCRHRFCGGFGGWPYAYGGFWPYGYGGVLYLPSDSGYASNPSGDLQTALANEQRVNAELADELREERLRSMEETQARSEAPAPAARAAQQPEPAQPPTVLVFRDGSRQEVQNYALVGDTLYEFAGLATKKIQLAQLDVPATVRVNDSRGVEFHLPAAHAAH